MKSWTDKFPDTGVSIFEEMSALAKTHNAINLAQGFPGFPPDPMLIELANKYMKQGYNQYAPMPGVLPLRELLVEKQRALYNSCYCSQNEITITAGATEAIFCAISTIISEGDEVIYFEPVFDIYLPAITLNKGIGIPVQLKYPTFDYDWDEVKSNISSRTKLIILNSPHNPTGKILKQKDLDALKDLLKDTSIFVLSDEVYEHMVFDGQKHISLSSDLFFVERSFVVGSLGKVLHCTGWRIGYCMAPENLMKAFRKIHQFVTFSANTAAQHAIAEFMKDENCYRNLSAVFQTKRDYFTPFLKESGFSFSLAEGSYFQVASYENISTLSDKDFSYFLSEEYKVAVIPVSAFYKLKQDHKLIRFCFAKNNEDLLEAGKRLMEIKIL